MSQDGLFDVQREIHQNDNLSLLTSNLPVLVDLEAAEIYRLLHGSRYRG